LHKEEVKFNIKELFIILVKESGLFIELLETFFRRIDVKAYTVVYLPNSYEAITQIHRAPEKICF
jgi:hypothetical protein